MNEWLSSFVDSTVQCWGCGVFDRLFQIVSDAAGLVYDKFATFSIILFCIMFSIFVVNAVWKTVRGNVSDPLYEKSIQRVFINAIICIGLLGAGVALPRFLTTITFEPVAQIAQTYTSAMINLDDQAIAERVTYQPQPMSEDGFYRPQMRDKIILIMKTTITQFQSYMKLGIAVMESAFTWHKISGVGDLLKRVALFFIGLYLTWGFFKLFFRYCCYFADIIIAMAFFAFFFPMSLMLFSFNGADNVPKWFNSLGKSLGAGQFKNLINAIITLASAVITYTVIMAIIARFFTASDMHSADLMNTIITGEIFDADLDMTNLEAMTLISCVVLVYILNFLQEQIPQVAKMVLSVFGVSEEKQLNEQLANDMMKLTQSVVDTTKKIGETIIGGGDKGKDNK